MSVIDDHGYVLSNMSVKDDHGYVLWNMSVIDDHVTIHPRVDNIPTLYEMYVHINTKVACRKSKDRKHNDHQKWEQMTNNDKQNIHRNQYVCHK
jgi:hypothetical protein